MLRFRNLRDFIRFKCRYTFEQAFIERTGPDIFDTSWRIRNYLQRVKPQMRATRRNSFSSPRRFCAKYASGEGPEEFTGTEKSERWNE